MQLSESIKTAWEQGKIIAINSSGEYRLFADEATPKSLGYEPLMGIIRSPKMSIVLVYVDPSHEVDEQVPTIIRVLGAMLNPKLQTPIDPKERELRDKELDARIAEKQEKEIQDQLDRLYRFAEECVRMELNIRGFPEDEPMLCFSSGNDDNFTYDDDEDTPKVQTVNL